MKKHQTHLMFHIKQKHTWFDISLLIALWILVFFFPENLWKSHDVSFLFLIKITTFVATLEFISFILFHLFSEKRSLLLQGFLGGFISSTTVFVQLNYDKRFAQINEKFIVQALLMAICSMLIECLLILVSVANHFSTLMVLPFLFMLIFIIIFILKSIFFTGPKKTESLEINDLEIDDPIVWKKVFSFSLFIILLKVGMILIQKFTSIPKIVAIFLTSIFEAHAVLAINSNAFSSANNLSEMYKVILVILVGSLISKMFLVLRGSNIVNKKLVLIPIITSTIMTILVSFFILLIF